MDWIEKAAARIRTEQPSQPSRPLPARETTPRRAPQPSAPPAAAGAPSDFGALLRSRKVDLDFASLKARGLLTPDAPRSKLAEEFRVIKRSLLRTANPSSARDRASVIMVTSARPSEGKTFVAVNLALSIALERDRTVLLVDCDVMHPEALRVLGVRSEHGLVDLIEDPAMDLASTLIRSNIDNLVMLPSGRFNPMSTELFASDRMRSLVAEMVGRYPDRVIILDTPPVLATSEPGVLSEYADRIAFVVEAERTADGEVETAIEHLRAPERVALILNKTRAHGNQEEFGYYYDGARHA